MRRAGRRDGGIDVGLDRNRHGPDPLAVHRTAHRLARFARTLDVGTVDEQPDAPGYSTIAPLFNPREHGKTLGDRPPPTAGTVPGEIPARSARKTFDAERTWCVPYHQPAWTGRRATSWGPIRTRLRRSITAMTITAARVTRSMIVARAEVVGGLLEHVAHTHEPGPDDRYRHGRDLHGRETGRHTSRWRKTSRVCQGIN